MLCRSIAVEGIDKVKKLIEGSEMAEIRIEKTGMNELEVKEVFTCHPNLIATCRKEGIANPKRKELLKAAIDGGAKWIDLEVESEFDFIQELSKYANSKGCKVIISYHNYKDTPDTFTLNKVINECRKKGAYLVKVATMVNSPSDIGRLMCLYSQDIPMLALGMGHLGNITRVAALKMGAPFTFVSCDGELETAPGQYTESKMKEVLNIL